MLSSHSILRRCHPNLSHAISVGCRSIHQPHLGSDHWGKTFWPGDSNGNKVGLPLKADRPHRESSPRTNPRKLALSAVACARRPQHLGSGHRTVLRRATLCLATRIPICWISRSSAQGLIVGDSRGRTRRRDSPFEKFPEHVPAHCDFAHALIEASEELVADSRDFDGAFHGYFPLLSNSLPS